MKKSIDNGFSAEEHFEAVLKIKTLYRNSRLESSKPDRDNDPNILSIKRFSADFVLKSGKSAAAYITVKEIKNGDNKIYSLELK